MEYKTKVCVVSSSRADYNHLYPLLTELRESKKITLQIVATGMHLLKKYGYTYKEIEKDGFKINKKISTYQKNTKDIEIVNSISRALTGMASAIKNLKPDIIIILGDRYDIYPVAIVAHILQIPLAHIHGGEVTSGSIDDGIRHSITKLANIHFVATNLFRNRVIAMGEQKNTVINIGSIGVEGNKNIKNISKKQVLSKFNIKKYDNYFIITLHPETVNESNKKIITNMLSALSLYKNYFFIFTGSNSDTGSDMIAKKIYEFISKNKSQSIFISSLGRNLYVNMMKHASLIIGNSSSGIIEAPSLKTATINIGNRQNGRPMSKSVFNASGTLISIKQSIKDAIKFDFKKNRYKPAYQGTKSISKIIKHISNINKDKLLNKKFYDK